MTPLARHDALPVAVEIRPIRTARRMRLRYDERRGLLKLTCPAGVSRRTALAWAAEQRSWVEAQISAAGELQRILDGSILPLDGADLLVRWDAKAPRTPRIEGGEIICGGPPEGLSKRLVRFLQTHALHVLSLETREYAAKAGVTVRAVSIGDPASRWGSCSSEGRIRYSWRLIMAPPAARRFVVAHEVAHIVHLNHGPEFKALEAALYEGDVSEARALLRRIGPGLRRVVGGT